MTKKKPNNRQTVFPVLMSIPDWVDSFIFNSDTHRLRFGLLITLSLSVTWIRQLASLCISEVIALLLKAASVACNVPGGGTAWNEGSDMIQSHFRNRKHSLTSESTILISCCDFPSELNFLAKRSPSYSLCCLGPTHLTADQCF